MKKTAEQIFMDTQKEWCPKCNNYTLPEKWQLDAMEAYAIKANELPNKLLASIEKMVSAKVERCVYYHSGATFIKTNKGDFMIKVEPYQQSEVVLG